MKEAIVKSPSGRIKRAAASQRGPLAVRGKDEKFVYRWANDKDDNVLTYREDGYEVVQDTDVSIGDKRVDIPTAPGSVKQASVGGGTKAVLMRKRRDWYLEDQEEKEQAIRNQERAMKKDALADYGRLETTRD
jgi:hypothetical protein